MVSFLSFLMAFLIFLSELCELYEAAMGVPCGKRFMSQQVVGMGTIRLSPALENYAKN